MNPLSSKDLPRPVQCHSVSEVRSAFTRAFLSLLEMDFLHFLFGMKIVFLPKSYRPSLIFLRSLVRVDMEMSRLLAMTLSGGLWGSLTLTMRERTILYVTVVRRFRLSSSSVWQLSSEYSSLVGSVSVVSSSDIWLKASRLMSSLDWVLIVKRDRDGCFCKDLGLNRWKDPVSTLNQRQESN